jgi:hypothetical protein
MNSHDIGGPIANAIVTKTVKVMNNIERYSVPVEKRYNIFLYLSRKELRERYC